MKPISSPELHRNSKFWLALPCLTKPPRQDSLFNVCELVLLWCWLPCELLVPVLVLSNPSYSVLPLDNFTSICECFGQFGGSFATVPESCTSRPISRPKEAAEDVQPNSNKFSTSQRVSDILATPTGSPGKKFFILETTSMNPSSNKVDF